MDPRFDVELISRHQALRQRPPAVDAVSLRIPKRQLLLPAGP